MSCVACSTIIAQVCLRTCGETCLLRSDGQTRLAVSAWLRRTYATPQRLKGSPRALTNTSGEATSPRTARQYCRGATELIDELGADVAVWNAQSLRGFLLDRAAS